MNMKLTKHQNYYRITPPLDGFCAGVTGKVINSIDYSLTREEIRIAEKKTLSRITGINTRNIVMLDQVHGDLMIHVVNEPSEDLPAIGEADGLITAIKGVMLVIRTADCVPVILYDPVKSVLGAVHSGWKGAMLDITGKCINEMKFICGSDPDQIKAFILPSIGPDSYEVNSDVSCYFPENTIVKNGKQFVDLWGTVEKSMVRAGVKKENIYNSGICNRINHAEFFSHRFGDDGRNLNFAYMK